MKFNKKSLTIRHDKKNNSYDISIDLTKLTKRQLENLMVASNACLILRELNRKK